MTVSGGTPGVAGQPSAGGILARLLSLPCLALLAVVVFAGVGIWQHGPRADYWLLLVASLGSFAGLCGYIRVALTPPGTRSWLLMVLTLGGLVPYLFGLYLVLVGSLWAVTQLGHRGTGGGVLSAGFLLTAGFVLLRGTYLLTEFAKTPPVADATDAEGGSRRQEVLTLLAGLVHPDAARQLEQRIPQLEATSPCWCGSGSRFQDCHRGRETEARMGLEEMRSAVEKTMRRHRRACLHPKAGPECSAPGASAHSLQRAELEKIAANGHVLGFPLSLPERLRSGRFEPSLMGIGKASTFTGFCSRHDTELFAVLETQPFAASDEQLFLLAYRGLCLELFAKEWSVLNLLPAMRLADRGQSVAIQIGIQAGIALDEIGKRAALELIGQEKARYDAAVLSRDFGQLRYLAFEFGGAPDIACTGALIPRGDFVGESRPGLAKLADLIPPMFTIGPTSRGGVAVLSWLGESPGNARLARSLDALSDADAPNALVRYAFTQCENLFLSPAWWKSVKREDQEALIARMNMKSAAESLRDDTRHVVSWNVSARLRRL